MVALSNFADMVRTAIEEGVDVIFSGAGLPVNLPEFLKAGVRTKLVPIVSSGRAAALIARRWLDKYAYRPDAFVVEGHRAGTSGSSASSWRIRSMPWKPWSPR